jgi:hypothetical protein
MDQIYQCKECKSVDVAEGTAVTFDSYETEDGSRKSDGPPVLLLLL